MVGPCWAWLVVQDVAVHVAKEAGDAVWAAREG